MSLYTLVSLGCIPRRRTPESKNRGFCNLNKLIKFSSKCLHQCIFSAALYEKLWLSTPSPTLSIFRPFTYCRFCPCKKIHIVILIAFPWLPVRLNVLSYVYKSTAHFCTLLDHVFYSFFVEVGLCFFFLLVYIMFFYILYNNTISIRYVANTFAPICSLSFHISLENSGFEANNLMIYTHNYIYNFNFILSSFCVLLRNLPLPQYYKIILHFLL